MDKTTKLLDIIDRLLSIVEYEQIKEELLWGGDEDDDLEDREEDWEDDRATVKSKLNKDGLPENNIVKCVGVDEDGNGIYKFK